MRNLAQHSLRVGAGSLRGPWRAVRSDCVSPLRRPAPSTVAVDDAVRLGTPFSRADLEASKLSVLQGLSWAECCDAADRDLATSWERLSYPGHTGVTPRRNVWCDPGNRE